jgi:hypothetical protein
VVLPDQTLLSVLPSVCELSQSALIDAVDLLADGPGSQLRVIARRLRHWHSAVAALSSHFEMWKLDLELQWYIRRSPGVSLQEVGMDDAISCSPVYLHDRLELSLVELSPHIPATWPMLLPVIPDIDWHAPPPLVSVVEECTFVSCSFCVRKRHLAGRIEKPVCQRPPSPSTQPAQNYAQTIPFIHQPNYANLYRHPPLYINTPPTIQSPPPKPGTRKRVAAQPKRRHTERVVGIER